MSDARHGLLVCPLEWGFLLQEPGQTPLALITEAEKQAKPLELDPFRGQLFEAFVMADAAGYLGEEAPFDLSADGLCRALAEQWGLGDATREAFTNQTKLGADQLARAHGFAESVHRAEQRSCRFELRVVARALPVRHALGDVMPASEHDRARDDAAPLLEASERLHADVGAASYEVGAENRQGGPDQLGPVLSRAILGSLDCAPRLGSEGSINYVLEVDFASRRLNVFAGKSGQWRGARVKKTIACVQRALPELDWAGLQHQHQYYAVAILATYPAPDTIREQPTFD